MFLGLHRGPFPGFEGQEGRDTNIWTVPVSWFILASPH